MGAYHNKLDKKYFNKSIYMRKFESAFNIKIKDYPLQYELVYETYNTFISLNNILFSLNYVPLTNKIDNINHLLNSYLNKYKNKIKKCYDSNCILMYESFENIVDEIDDCKIRNIKYNLKSLEKDIEIYMSILDKVDFDKLVDSKIMPYHKIANDKLAKKVNLKIIEDIDIKSSTLFNNVIQNKLNDYFINNYFKKTGIDLNKEPEQLHFIFDTLNRIKDLNNAIVDYQIYKDKAVLNIFNFYLSNDYLKQDISFVKDITYINVFNKLKGVSKNISDDNIDIAYKELKNIIEQFKDLYERNS